MFYCTPVLRVTAWFSETAERNARFSFFHVLASQFQTLHNFLHLESYKQLENLFPLLPFPVLPSSRFMPETLLVNIPSYYVI